MKKERVNLSFKSKNGAFALRFSSIERYGHSSGSGFAQEGDDHHFFKLNLKLRLNVTQLN